MKLCSCNGSCTKEVFGIGLFAKGHNSESHSFKHNDKYRRILSNRNKSKLMREKVSFGLKKRHREDKVFAASHRRFLAIMNKTEEHRNLQKSSKRRKQRALITKRNWLTRSEEEKALLVRKLIVASHKKPNKPEKLLRDILDKAFPGEFKLNVKGGMTMAGKIPDFVNVNGKKVLIEMFGDYWHGVIRTGISNIQAVRERKACFAKYGFKTLVVWEKDLKDPKAIIEKVDTFLGGVN